MIRVSDIGDPSSCSDEQITEIKTLAQRARLALVGYTHKWRTDPRWKGLLMASCETLEAADQARAAGWKAATFLPTPTTTHTPAGHRIIQCPAEKAPGKVTCNNCRLCDGSRPGPVIGFTPHGNGASRIRALINKDQS
jgi:hypothetical protein